MICKIVRSWAFLECRTPPPADGGLCSMRSIPRTGVGPFGVLVGWFPWWCVGLCDLFSSSVVFSFLSQASSSSFSPDSLSHLLLSWVTRTTDSLWLRHSKPYLRAYCTFLGNSRPTSSSRPKAHREESRNTTSSLVSPSTARLKRLHRHF